MSLLERATPQSFVLRTLMRAILSLGVLLLALPMTGMSQDDDDRGEGQGDERAEDVKEFADQYDERFLGRAPRLGETLPELTAWSEDGKPFDFESTRGSYTVIVFGCLT